MSLDKTTMNDWAEFITRWRMTKGFITPSSIATEEEKTMMMSKLMLVVTEVAEAAEALRHDDKALFDEELADTIIRLLDICGACNIDIEEIDIEEEVKKKMLKNQSRPHKHGKVL